MDDPKHLEQFRKVMMCDSGPGPTHNHRPKTCASKLNEIEESAAKGAEIAPQNIDHILGSLSSKSSGGNGLAASQHAPKEGTDQDGSVSSKQKSKGTSISSKPEENMEESSEVKLGLKHRTVNFRNLVANRDARFVCSLVKGGAVQNIELIGRNGAAVTFISSSAAHRFYQDNKKGIIYGKCSNGQKRIAKLELHITPESMNGRLQEYRRIGVSRCVTVFGPDHQANIEELKVQPWFQRFNMEAIDEKFPTGIKRIVEFRLCSLEDAIAFRGYLMRNEVWGQYDIIFSRDPCARKTKRLP